MNHFFIFTRMDTWKLGARSDIDRSTILPGGFHPLFVKGQPNSLCLHLTMPGLDRVGRGMIVTDYEGVSIPPIHITTSPCRTLEAAIETTIRTWERVVKYIETGTPDPSVKHLTDKLSFVDPEPTTSGLEVGEYIAYFLPEVPVCDQAEFIITQVTGVRPFTLANGHEQTVFKDGRGHVARYNPVNNRIVFPAVDIRQVILD